MAHASREPVEITRQYFNNFGSSIIHFKNRSSMSTFVNASWATLVT